MYVNILHNSSEYSKRNRKKGRFLLLNVTVFKCSSRSPLLLLLIQLHWDCGWSRIFIELFCKANSQSKFNLRVVFSPNRWFAIFCQFLRHLFELIIRWINCSEDLVVSSFNIERFQFSSTLSFASKVWIRIWGNLLERML